MAHPQFEVVETDQVTDPVNDTSRVLDLLLFLLRPQLILFYSLLTVGSVFWLALAIIPHQPSIEQLVGLAGYGAFVIAINIIVRRK